MARVVSRDASAFRSTETKTTEFIAATTTGVSIMSLLILLTQGIFGGTSCSYDRTPAFGQYDSTADFPLLAVCRHSGDSKFRRWHHLRRWRIRCAGT